MSHGRNAMQIANTAMISVIYLAFFLSKYGIEAM